MIASAFWGELLGTLVLILLGNGVVANVVLQKTKGHGGGWIVITAGWAFAVMVGIFVAQATGSVDAHLNPAVTLAFAFASNDYHKILPYWSAQLIGAFLGAALVWLQYRPHWAATDSAADKLACFSTSPAIRQPAWNLWSEVVGTAMLVLGANAISASGNLSIGWGPYLTGMLVWSIGLSLGGNTGYAINPARDLGPRLAHTVLPIAGKGGSDWPYAWVPAAGPLLGAVLGAWLFGAFR